MARHDAEAFRFPENYDPLPELEDEVVRLKREGRHRSALDLILRFLRANGRSAPAFQCALAVLGTLRGTPDPRVVEPVTRAQLGNAYFAPIASECAHCRTFWYSVHSLFDHHVGMRILNPVGRQCQVCRYTLCRNCLSTQVTRCPEPGCSGDFGIPVLPTGRPAGQPANPFTEKLEHVLVLWQDTPPGQEEVDNLLDLACTWQDRGGITVRSHVYQADPQDDEDAEPRVGLTLVALHERHGMLSEGALHRTRLVPIEAAGRGRRLLLVTAAPDTGPASRLSGPITYHLDEPDAEEPDAEETGAEKTGAGTTETGGTSTGATETGGTSTDSAQARAPKRRWFRRRR